MRHPLLEIPSTQKKENYVHPCVMIKAGFSII